MKKTILASALVLFFCTLDFTHAQIDQLRSNLQTEKEELQSLERVLSLLNSGDTTYASYFPVWTVLDRNMKLSIYNAFRNRGKTFSEDDQVVIIATPNMKSIADIRIGTISYGRLLATKALDPELHKTLLEQKYVLSNDIPAGYRTDTRNRKRELIDNPNWVSLNISLFGGTMKFGNDWRLVGTVGNDELGYPFWSSGQILVMAGYKSIQLGGYLPLHGGVFETNPAERPLSLKPRLLNGSSGVAGSFEFEWDAVKINSPRFTYGSIGGSFAVGSLDRRRPEYLTFDLNRLYSITTILQTYYGFNYQFDDEKILSSRLGVTYHRVTLNRYVDNEIFRHGDAEALITPLVSVEYRNLGADWFKLRAQYSRLMSLGAWAEIVPQYVYAEVKYATPLFRTPSPWEQRYYLYATLGFNFDF
ncbi:MAG: hypothetical protein HY961_00435 [Ignavibacteriae bacterium]|nr:hypothetical protein [Ignavibacteriota bacterium]